MAPIKTVSFKIQQYLIGIKLSDIKWMDTSNELDSKATMNSNLKKMSKKITIKKNRLEHAISSNIRKEPNFAPLDEKDEFDEDCKHSAQNLYH